MCKCSDWKSMPCEVCQLLDGDATEKRCKFCSTCNAWICEMDFRNIPRRAAAAVKKAVGSIKEVKA